VTNILGNPIYAAELDGVKRVQRAIVSHQAWNAANR
jgi:hypothetical protein